MSSVTRGLTTDAAVQAVAWGRAPTHPGGRVNLRIVCLDGFALSAQASPRHYASDSSGRMPYWDTSDEPRVDWPYATFEVGYTTDDPAPAEVWERYDSGGVWARVPIQVVADLLNAHGGAVAWEPSQE